MTATTKTAKTGVARRADKPKASDAVKRENRTGWAFMAPFGILFALVFILPIIWAIYSSFFRQVTTGGGAYGGGELVDKFVGLQNFQYVITSGNFWAGVGRVVLGTAAVTDEALLAKTGGIVQGMSGSPVIQNGRLVGAVTHVLLSAPTKGYGISVETMLETGSPV